MAGVIIAGVALIALGVIARLALAQGRLRRRVSRDAWLIIVGGAGLVIAGLVK